MSGELAAVCQCGKVTREMKKGLCLECAEKAERGELIRERDPVDVEKELETITGALSRLFDVSLEDAAEIVAEGYKAALEDE